MSAPLILVFSSDAAVVETVQAAVAASRREFRHLGSDYGAMAVIHAAGPDAALAFVDLDPAMHGFELCRAASQHMPVIVVLGDRTQDCGEAAREHGACGCVYKPLDTARVRALLDETLGVEAPLEL